MLAKVGEHYFLSACRHPLMLAKHGKHYYVV
jgi:hypothetical protein